MIRTWSNKNDRYNARRNNEGMGGVNCDIKTIKAGDIVYIKKCNVGSDITVRAIGIVTDYEIKKVAKVAEIARNVKWIDTNSFVITNPKNTDKNNVRSNSVYEEYNLEVIGQIIGRM